LTRNTRTGQYFTFGIPQGCFGCLESIVPVSAVCNHAFIQYGCPHHRQNDNGQHKHEHHSGNQYDASLLSADTETEILAKLAAYPEIVTRAANSYEPHQIGNYLKELAALFHGWYAQEDVKILDEQNTALSQARLLLSLNVQQVIRNGLELLGVSAPESM